MLSVLIRISVDMLVSIVMLLSMSVVVVCARTPAARLARRSPLNCMMCNVWWVLSAYGDREMLIDVGLMEASI